MIGQSKTRLLGVTVLIAMFAVGGLTGAVVQRTALADKTQPRMQQRGPSLFETLKLTDEQQKQVCSIMQANAEQMKPHASIMQGEWKAIGAIIASTNTAIDSVLTPEQRATKDEFRKARQKYFQDRQAQEKSQDKGQDKSQKPGDREHRGARPGPGNPLGVTCPGLNDGPESRGQGGPRGGMPWGGDSSHGSRDAHPSAPAAKPQHET